MRVIIVAGMLLALAGCGRGSGNGNPAAASGPPPEVVKALQMPDNPYRIIYYPPVDLTKRPAAPK